MCVVTLLKERCHILFFLWVTGGKRRECFGAGQVVPRPRPGWGGVSTCCLHIPALGCGSERLKLARSSTLHSWAVTGLGRSKHALFSYLNTFPWLKWRIWSHKSPLEKTATSILKKKKKSVKNRKFQPTALREPWIWVLSVSMLSVTHGGCCSAVTCSRCVCIKVNVAPAGEQLMFM